MARLQPVYRILILTLLLCIGGESLKLYNDVDVVEQDKTEQSQEFLKAAEPMAVLPVVTVQITKWLFVADVYSVELGTVTTVNTKTALNIILSYFEVLFETCIKVNAP